MLVSLCLLAALIEVKAADFNGEDYWLLPRLFDLDNYDECLSHPDGLYCLGSFHLTPAEQPNRVYELMTNYSKELYRFNRTVIRRGWCVSARESNVTAEPMNRFEHCAAEWARSRRMRARLLRLEYCRSHSDVHATRIPDKSELTFLIAIAVIILLNAASTAYDYATQNNEKKIALLTTWSVVANWRQLVEPYKSERKSLQAIQGIKVIASACICIVHSGILLYTLFLYEPREMEQVIANPLTMAVQNSTTVVHMFIVLSSFLTVHNLLKSSKPFGFGTFLRLLAKRIIRLSPVCLLVIGFAGTWWPRVSDGPLWPAAVAEQSKICREKFWAHAFFIHNLVEPDKFCLIPTWYIAVDMQMYILAVILTMILAKFSKKAVPILVILFIGATALNAGLAYIYEWKSLLYLAIVAENINSIFRDIPSLGHFYMSPWGSLPACLVGLIIGHLVHFTKGETFGNIYKRRLLSLYYVLCIPIMVGWLMLGNYFQHIRHPIFVAAYAALERSIFQIMCILAYIALVFKNDICFKALAWRGWHLLAQLSLSVMQIHWCIALFIIGPSPQPVAVSVFNLLPVSVTTVCFTYPLALLLTVLVELPMKRTFDFILR
ncbi:regulator of hypoxia-inducible factor 1-like [Bombyx mandarina]|uniref:Regulator of hypoxia-inducible factor 1-like n=1 Tax=Bombyx mandarina TaxID=7092 RepID=A0A6J2KMN2_BOMMA|nr:regulator of hypoxia-inducible factor 1-like [Bombyx mandarina]